MALSDLTDYRDKTDNPQQVAHFTKAAFYGSGTAWNSWWIGTGGWGASIGAGTTPTASVVTDRTTQGALGQYNPASGDLRVWLRSLVLGSGNVAAAGIMIADRLVHSAGLDGTVTSAQTTNLPTAALTRYTTGVQVFAALEIYTALGATQTTATVSYTNDAGTAGQTSQPIAIGGTGLNTAQRFLPVSLAAGDKGVRAVASVTLAASTLTAGNFGVTLYRPLLVLPVRAFADYVNSGDPLRELGFHLPKVEDDACLFALGIAAGQAATTIAGEICFMEA